MIRLPFVVVVQHAGGEFLPMRGDSLIELLDAIPGFVRRPGKKWIADVFAGSYRIGIMDVRNGDVHDDAGIVVQTVSPESAAAYDKRAG